MSASRTSGPPHRSEIRPHEVPGGIRKLERRLQDIAQARALPPQEKRATGRGTLLAKSINATLDDVFGAGTAETKDFKVLGAWFWSTLLNASPAHEIQCFDEGLT